jgi:hypothetical protein
MNKMKVLKVIDQEDGSAIVDLEMSSEESNFFLRYAILDILRKQIKIEGEKLNEHGSDRSGEQVQE